MENAGWFVLAQHCWLSLSFRFSRAPMSSSVNCSIACFCHLILVLNASLLNSILLFQGDCEFWACSVQERTPCSLPAPVKSYFLNKCSQCQHAIHHRKYCLEWILGQITAGFPSVQTPLHKGPLMTMLWGWAGKQFCSSLLQFNYGPRFVFPLVSFQTAFVAFRTCLPISEMPSFTQFPYPQTLPGCWVNV